VVASLAAHLPIRDRYVLQLFHFVFQLPDQKQSFPRCSLQVVDHREDVPALRRPHVHAVLDEKIRSTLSLAYHFDQRLHPVELTDVQMFQVICSVSDEGATERIVLALEQRECARICMLLHLAQLDNLVAERVLANGGALLQSGVRDWLDIGLGEGGPTQRAFVLRLRLRLHA